MDKLISNNSAAAVAADRMEKDKVSMLHAGIGTYTHVNTNERERERERWEKIEDLRRTDVFANYQLYRD